MNLLWKAQVTSVYGQPHLGLGMVLDGERMAIESGDREAIAVSRVLRAVIERWMGSPEQAVQLIDPVVMMARNMASRSRFINVLSATALHWLRRGESRTLSRL